MYKYKRVLVTNILTMFNSSVVKISCNFSIDIQTEVGYMVQFEVVYSEHLRTFGCRISYSLINVDPAGYSYMIYLARTHSSLFELFLLV